MSRNFAHDPRVARAQSANRALPIPKYPSVLSPDGAGTETHTRGLPTLRHPGPGSHARQSRDPSYSPAEPDFFRDLNLDQVVAAITAGQSDYDLTYLYRSPLTTVDAITFRHRIFRDLERPELAAIVRAFTDRRVVYHAQYRTREIREDDHGLNHFYRERFFLNAVQDYCTTVCDLHAGLSATRPTSRGLSQFAACLGRYVDSAEFQELRQETQHLENELDAITYVLAIQGDRLTVAGYDDEPDYGEYVAATFARFQQHPVTDTAGQSGQWEAFAGTGVLDLVAQLYPAPFAALDTFCGHHLDYIDPLLAAFDHDIQFYLAYLDFITPLRQAGLHFSYPRLSETDKNEQALDTFDLALARTVHAPTRSAATTRETAPREPIVGNDITLHGNERILVISGPNNGGKTTLARTFGQLHYLARLGCPIPGRDTQLLVCDQIFTHFERTEDSATMVGRLQSELNRLRDDFAAATPNSVFILNEVFNSTTAADALHLSTQILEKVTELGALGVCVTFLDELATLNDATVSMVSTVVPDNPASRTHKVLRRPADGRAYAHALAEKYGLTFDQLVCELSSDHHQEGRP